MEIEVSGLVKLIRNLEDFSGRSPTCLDMTRSWPLNWTGCGLCMKVWFIKNLYGYGRTGRCGCYSPAFELKVVTNMVCLIPAKRSSSQVRHSVKKDCWLPLSSIICVCWDCGGRSGLKMWHVVHKCPEGKWSGVWMVGGAVNQRWVHARCLDTPNLMSLCFHL